MPEPLTVGARLGSAYILDAPAGAGAQGEVWLAHADSDPGTPLAIKILRADLVEDSGVVERFIRERATLMRVSSPYVVGVRDMVIEGSRFAIVMDHIGGGDLRDHLAKTGPLPPAELARVGAMLAEGLAAIHAAGIVHRDLKPANVLIDTTAHPATPSGQTASAASTVPVSYGTVNLQGPAYGVTASGAPVTPGTPAAPGAPDAPTWVPRLADFGVARLVDTVSASLATGAIGTPLYMAPEVLDPTAPTCAADVYSLGVVLYEAACGVPPFHGVPSQVLAQHLRRNPGRPDGIPDPLWDLIMWMMTKQPASRPSAEAVAEHLAHMAPSLAGLPAARRLAEPPRSAPSANPYELVPEEDLISTRVEPHTATRVDPRGPAPTGYTATPAAGSTSPAVWGYGVGAVTRPLPGTGPEPLPDRAAPLPERAAPSRRRRRLLLGSIVVVVVLALVLGGLYLWWDRGRDSGLAGTVAVLPAQARVAELQQVPDVWEHVLSPDGGALAAEHADGWSLYDLSGTDQSAVWTGECSYLYFWTNTQVLCDGSNTDTLVSLDGSQTTEIPGPTERTVVGTSGTAAVVIDDSYEGSLVAIDASGSELWRRDGGYREGLVSEHFIVTFENGSERLQVLSASTGEVLLSEAVNLTPSFDSELPGGVGIDVGGQAFYVVGDSTTTVYDANGVKVGTVSGTPARSSWVASAPLSPEALVDLLEAATEGGTVVRGTSKTVTLTVDTTACTVTGPDGVSYSVPERTDGEACVITPLGLIGGDSAVLFAMGQPSSRANATGATVIAYGLSDGAALWQTSGVLEAVLPASEQAAGDAAGQPRVLVNESDGSSGSLIISAIIAT